MGGAKAAFSYAKGRAIVISIEELDAHYWALCRVVVIACDDCEWKASDQVLMVNDFNMA